MATQPQTLGRSAEPRTTVPGVPVVPGHVAIIMDGNGRWARERGQERLMGHRAGTENIRPIIEKCVELGVEILTVYAFSTENWRRPGDEVRFLMRFNESLLVRRRDELNEMGVRIRFIGRRDWRVPKRLLRRMDESVALTAANRKLTLTIAFNYGSRAELVDAVKALLMEGADPATIDEADIAKRLYDPEMPDVDLWVRTSGEHRISNYLLWQSAYAEMVFVDTFWPAFRRDDLAGAVAEYQRRDRRFGGLKG